MKYIFLEQGPRPLFNYLSYVTFPVYVKLMFPVPVLCKQINKQNKYIFLLVEVQGTVF